MTFGIIGGGWAGLLSALELKKTNPKLKIEVLEKESEKNFGGLLRSETIDGFTYDIGGPHILFSKNKEILNSVLEILEENWKLMERKNFIHFDGKILPYPFENGIYMLPPSDRAKIGFEILRNLIRMESNRDWVPDSFHDWIYDIFGHEMGSRYLEPYNRKIWKRDLKSFDASWVFTPGRLPLPSMEDIIYSISGAETIGYKEQAHFYYPKNGGIQTLYESILSKVKGMGVEIISSIDVKKIRKDQEGKLVVNDRFIYDKLVSTMPIGNLVKAIDAPDEITGCAKNLDYNQVVVCGFALDQPSPDRITLYVPQEDVIFHRYTWMNNLVSCSPAGKSNLIVEITVPKNQKIEVDRLLELAKIGLIKLGIIDDERKIIHSKAWVNKYGYPVYMKGHNQIRNKIMNYINTLGITSVGRWGSWHYWNTDKVIEAVIENTKNSIS